MLEFGSRAQFDALVERLKAPTPVRPQGVAQALLMITGGTGPLWGVGGEVELARAAGRALVALERGPAVSAADG